MIYLKLYATDVISKARYLGEHAGRDVWLGAIDGWNCLVVQWDEIRSDSAKWAAIGVIVLPLNHVSEALTRWHSLSRWARDMHVLRLSEKDLSDIMGGIPGHPYA